MDAWEIARRIKLDRHSGNSLYAQIRDGIRGLINSRVLPCGKPLPSEQKMAESLRVSRMTLRQALAELKRAGYLECKHGLGNIVRQPQPRFIHQITELSSFSEDMRARGLTPASQVLKKYRIAANPEVANQLRCQVGDPLFFLERLRLADGVPLGLHAVYLPAGLVDFEDLGQKPLYDSLAEVGVWVHTAEEFIEACAAKRREAMLLGLRVGEPLLLITRITYDQRSRPVELVYARYRSDVYRYHARLARKTGGVD